MAVLAIGPFPAVDGGTNVDVTFCSVGAAGEQVARQLPPSPQQQPQQQAHPTEPIRLHVIITSLYRQDMRHWIISRPMVYRALFAEDRPVVSRPRLPLGAEVTVLPARGCKPLSAFARRWTGS